PQTPLEQIEQLEQLRVLEHGYRILVVPTTYESVGVDTPEDVARAERLLAHLPPHSSLRRTSSRGADPGYGLISSRPASSTRGPMPLGQMDSQIGPNMTRSCMSRWIWYRISWRLLWSISTSCCLNRASMSA